MKSNSSFLAIAEGVAATHTEAMLNILQERGRGFSSPAEAWAELRLMMEQIEKGTKMIKGVHGEMWSAVGERNQDAFSVLLQEFERAADDMARIWICTAALAEIALEDPQLPPEEDDAAAV